MAPSLNDAFVIFASGPYLHPEIFCQSGNLATCAANAPPRCLYEAFSRLKVTIVVHVDDNEGACFSLYFWAHEETLREVALSPLKALGSMKGLHCHWVHDHICKVVALVESYEVAFLED